MEKSLPEGAIPIVEVGQENAREQACQKAKEKEKSADYVAKIWYHQLTDFFTRSDFIESSNENKPAISIPSIIARLEEEADIDAEVLRRLTHYASGAKTISDTGGKTKVVEVERNGYLIMGMGACGSQKEKRLADVGSLRFVRVSEQTQADTERDIKSGEYEIGFHDFLKNFLEVMRLEGALTVKEKEEVMGKVKGNLAAANLVFGLVSSREGDVYRQTKLVDLRLEPEYGRELSGRKRYAPLKELKK